MKSFKFVKKTAAVALCAVIMLGTAMSPVLAASVSVPQNSSISGPAASSSALPPPVAEPKQPPAPSFSVSSQETNDGSEISSIESLSALQAETAPIPEKPILQNPPASGKKDAKRESELARIAPQAEIVPAAPQKLNIATIETVKLFVGQEELSSTTPIVITKSTKIELRYTWKMDENYDTNAITASDYSILGKLPANLPFAADLTKLNPIEIKTTDKAHIIGHVTFNGNDEIVLTYHEQVQGLANVTGSFSIKSQVDFSSTQTPGDTMNIIMKDDGTFTFEKIGERPVVISKKLLRATQGVDYLIHRQYKFDTLVWEIDINTNESKIDNAVITDVVSNTITGNSAIQIAKRHYFKSLRVEVYPLTVTKNTGGTVSLAPGTALSNGAVANADGGEYAAKLPATDGDTMKIELGDITKAYRIILRSDSDSSYYFGKSWEHIYFTNEATLTGTDEQSNPVDESAKATHLLSIPSQRSKWGDYSYDKTLNKHFVTWTLCINKMDLDFGAKGENVVLIDTLNPGLKFVSSPFLSPNGEKDVYDGSDYDLARTEFGLDNAQVNLTPSGNYRIADPTAEDIVAHPAIATTTNTDDTMTVTFQNLNNKGYRMRYKTEITDLPLFLKNGVRNNVVYTIPDYGDEKVDATVTAPVKVGTVDLKKEALVNEMTYDTLSWKVVYNTGTSTAKTPVVISDAFIWPENKPEYSIPYSMKMIEESLVVDYDGTTLNKTTDYTIAPGKDGNGSYADGFQVTLTKPDTGITGKLTLTYKTNYTLANVGSGQDLGARKGGIFKNIVEVAAKIDSATVATTLRVSAEQAVSDTFAVNALKSGAFIANNKNTIGWVVDLNYLGVNLDKNVKFEDKFGENLVFKGDINALAVYKVTNKTQESLLSKDSDYTVVEPPVGSDKGFVLLFKDMDTNHIRIKYETDLKDPNSPTEKFTNNGEMTAYTNKTIRFSAEAARPTDKTYLLKAVGTNTADTNLLHFSLKVNEKNVTLNNAVLTDKMGSGLVLDKSSIIVALNSDGTSPLTAGTDYHLTGGDPDPSGSFTEFEIKFLNGCNPLTQTVYVLYSARLDADAAAQDPIILSRYIVSNEAKLVADEVTTWTTVSTSTFITSGFGEGNGKETVFLQIKKVDKGTKATLASAEFELLHSDGTTARSKIIINANGYSDKIRVERGEYTLVETKAPAGYKLPTGAAARTAVDVRTGNKNVEIEVENEKVPSSSSAPISSSTPPSSSQSSSVPPPVSASSSVPSSKPMPTSSKPIKSKPPVYVVSSSTPDVPVVVPTPPTPTPPAPPVRIVPLVRPEVPGTTPPPAVVDTPTDLPVVQGDIIPDVEPEAETIDQEDIPLAGLEQGMAWSLLNLLMALVSLFAAVVLLVSMMHRKKLNQQAQEAAYDELAGIEDGPEEDYVEEEKETKERSRLTAIRLPAIIMGLAPGLLFLVLENIRLPMTWITQWTPIIGAFFILHMVLLIVHGVVSKREKDAKNQGNNPDNPDIQPA